MRYRHNAQGGAPEVWDEGLGDYRAMSSAEAESYRMGQLGAMRRPAMPPSPHPRLVHDEAYLEHMLNIELKTLDRIDITVAKRIAVAYADLMFRRYIGGQR